MVTRLLRYKLIQITLTSLIVIGMLICIFTPNYFLFKWGAEYAVQLMLSYLFLGLSFLVLQQPRLMFTSLACCAGLCLFLKSSTNSNMLLPTPTNEEVVKVAHFNVSASNEDYFNTIQSMLQTEADIISIQELTPDWHNQIRVSLKQKYPYSKSVIRIDPHGLAVYSKYPLVKIDTFLCNNIPSIVGSIKANGKGRQVHFISSHSLPPFNSRAYEKLKQHLNTVAAHINDLNGAMIALGEFNVVSWSNEIQEFRESTKLMDSRRGFTPSFSDGAMDLFRKPMDHIFYSDHLECIGFETISSKNSNHLGIQGSYQFTNTLTSNVDKKKNPQF